MEVVSVSLVSCRACNRYLRKPESLARGIGPICLKRANESEIAAAVIEDQPVVEPMVLTAA